MSETRIVCDLEDMEPNSARRFEVAGQAVAVVRTPDAVYAIGDRCSHADFSLSEGEVDADSCTLECWKHGATFSLTSGEPQALPATKSVPVYEAKVVDGKIEVTVS